MDHLMNEKQSPGPDDFMDDSDSSSDNESVNSKKNIRPVHNIGQACKFCKKRHIRCDGNYPCTQCVKRNLQCTFGTKTKRGPKPKTDLYEHCNKLMVDLEVQKQIAEYWKEQFMTAMRKHGKDGNEFVEQHGLHPPVFAADLERLNSNSVTAGLVPTTNNNNSNNGNNTSPNSNMITANNNSQMDADSSKSGTTSPLEVRSSSPFVPHVSYRDPKPFLTTEQIKNMLALFTEHIQPLVPDYIFNYSADLCLEAWNSTKAERDALEDHTKLTDMFEHCVIAAHGFRLANEPEIMHRFAKKAEDLLQLLFFQRESQCQPELAQKLVQVLILLSFYYGGDDRDGSKQSVIMLAYQIISMHRTFIAPATMHRVYYTMMSLSENQADRVYWFNQASSLATQMKIKSLASLTAASMMFIFSSLHPKANFEQAPPAFTKQQLLAFLKKIEEATAIFTQNAPEGMPLTNEAISTFSVLMIGCKSELLYLLGNYESAQASAEWTIQTASNLLRPLHVCLFGVQCAAEVALALNLTNAIDTALSLYERHSAALPIASRFKRRVLGQLNLINSALSNPQAEIVNSIPVATPIPNNIPMNTDILTQGISEYNQNPAYLAEESLLQNPYATNPQHSSGTPFISQQQMMMRGTRPLQPLRVQPANQSSDQDIMLMYSEDYPNFN